MELFLDTRKMEDYATYLKIKRLPRYRFQGHVAIFPDEYAHMLGITTDEPDESGYVPEDFLFDYQGGVCKIAIRKRKFAGFIACGVGKSNCILSIARYVAAQRRKGKVLIVCPLMVCPQTISEAQRFWGKYPIEQIAARDLQKWLTASGGAIGITNYEAIREGLRPGKLAGLILDESSLLKNASGTTAMRLIDIGKELDWKFCFTGTPAPNDRIEYASHSVFLDRFPTVNSFLAKYFVNRGETHERWVMKPHAIRPFYRQLSDWCIFLENPATYGWKDNTDNIPPIVVHQHPVPLTAEQRSAVSSVTKCLLGIPGGIASRSKLSQLAKGRHGGKDMHSNKIDYIRDIIAAWSATESTIVWCRFNNEQDRIAAALPGCGSISGATKDADRQRIIADFQAGRIRTLVSKPDVLGFGLNLQVATRHVFNGLWDSSEEYHQCVKRSNRIGSTKPLNVHIPVTDIEYAMVSNTLRKLRRMEEDTREQERLFREVGYVG